jgi:hypothetical protein
MNISNISLDSQYGTAQVAWFIISLAVICGVGTITNFINVFVFLNSKFKDKVYKYMLVSCIFELFYLVINSFTTMLQCGTAYDKYLSTLGGQIVTVYFVNYLSSVFALFCILIEIFLAFQRYTFLVNRPFLPRARLAIILPSLFLFASFVHSPSIACNVIVFNPITQTYSFKLNEFEKTNAGKILKSVSSWIRIALTLGVLTSLSLLTAIHSKNHLKKRDQATIQLNTTYENGQDNGKNKFFCKVSLELTFLSSIYFIKNFIN